MSDMKYDALVGQGIEIVERIPIPDELIPADAHVEIAAKKAAGYYSPEPTRRDAVLDPFGRALKNNRAASLICSPWLDTPTVMPHEGEASIAPDVDWTHVIRSPACGDCRIAR